MELIRTGRDGHCYLQRCKVIASYWARKVRTLVPIGHRGTRAQHHSDPPRAMCSLTGCTKLLELLTRDVLRVSSCRSRKGARNRP